MIRILVLEKQDTQIQMNNNQKKTTEEILKESYNNVLNSGMFWEFHPELSGEYEKDRMQYIDYQIDLIKWTFASSEDPDRIFGQQEIKEFLKSLEELRYGKPLVAQGSQEITGRGLIFVVDLDKNNLDVPPKVGDRVRIDGKTYVVLGTEMQRIMDSKIKPLIGLNVIAV